MGEILWVPLHPRARRPSRAHAGDAGWDLAILDGCHVLPGQTTNLRTGVVAVPPPGWWWLLAPRSSCPLELIPGVIDAGYQGELFLRVRNSHPHGVDLEEGQRLAQLILLPAVDVRWVQVPTSLHLPRTDRGSRGFGSSG